MSTISSSLTELGVRRPILIAVVNILIMLAGMASFMGVDIRELPNIDRPVVSVRAIYDGASPETMDAEVTSILEGAVARVSGVKRIQSSSEENNMRMRVEFDIGYDLNTAANDVREAVSRIERDLPEDVEQITVIKADDDAEDIIQLSAFSNTLLQQDLAERIEKDVVPELLSISGVANVRLEGIQPKELRVMLDPVKMSAYHIDILDIINAIEKTRFDVPAGSYDSHHQELFVRAYASVVDPEEIEQLHITNNVRLRDLAQVYYAPTEYESYTMLDGRMVIGLGIVRQAGSNTIKISNEVNKRIQQINQKAKDFNLMVTTDDAKYIQGALKEVVFTLCFAIITVLLVIIIFLGGQWQSIFVPAVTIPISLIGTIATIWMFGFSINLLTLLALVLATGLIVDDAIIVLENIQRLKAKGIENLAAAVLGTKQVFFAVIATTITLVSVFLPIAFLPGETGRLFREFGLVLVFAVIISLFVAVTLCPMLASKIKTLSSNKLKENRLRMYLIQLGMFLAEFYRVTLEWILAKRVIALICFSLIAIIGVIGFFNLNQELLPIEDRGKIRVFLTGPDGSSLNYTDKQAQYVENILYPYHTKGIFKNIYSIIGRWDKNRAYIVGTLNDWKHRSLSQMELAKSINQSLKDIPGAQVRIIQDSALGRTSSGTGLKIALLGNDYNDIYTAAKGLANAVQEKIQAINDVKIQFDTSQPELSFNIDREKANDLNVPLDRISLLLRVMVNKYHIMDLSVADQSIPVVLRAAEGKISNINDLLNVFITNTDNKLVPLSALIDVNEQGVSAELDRHEQRRAINLDLGLEPGISLGNIVDQVRAIANKVLPSGISIIFIGEASILEETNIEVTIAFMIALLVVFFVLAGQFESFGSAFIVMFTVPFSLATAVFALYLTGQTLNLYTQIGFVMLIGLISKNAILLVEFIDQLRDQGRSVSEAIIEGVQIRLRPIAMTVLSTLISALPLIITSGPGEEARKAIGWVIFGGLGISTLITLYLTPISYSLIAPFIKARVTNSKELDKQLTNASTNHSMVTDIKL